MLPLATHPLNTTYFSWILLDLFFKKNFQLLLTYNIILLVASGVQHSDWTFI